MDVLSFETLSFINEDYYSDYYNSNDFFNADEFQPPENLNVSISEIDKNQVLSETLKHNGWIKSDTSLLYATFRRKKLDIEKSFTDVQTLEGNCIKFSSENMTQTIPGSGNGLQIALNFRVMKFRF